MNRTATDELDRIDEAFAGNRLLSTFPKEARALVEPFAAAIDLQLGAIVHSTG